MRKFRLLRTVTKMMANAPSAIPMMAPLFSVAQFVIESFGLSSLVGALLGEKLVCRKEGKVDGIALKEGPKLVPLDGIEEGAVDGKRDGCTDGLELLNDGTELAFAVGGKDGDIDGCSDGSNDWAFDMKLSKDT